MTKARKQYKCEKCGRIINIGDEYNNWGGRFLGGIHHYCKYCKPKLSQLTSSEYLKSIYEIQEKVESYVIGRDTAEEYYQFVLEIIDELNEIKENLEEKMDNIPENLQFSETYSLLEERLSCVESVIEQLEDLDNYDTFSRDDAIDELEISDDNIEESEEDIEELVEERNEEIVNEIAESVSDILSSLE